MENNKSFEHLHISKLRESLEQKQWNIIDIRDVRSYQTGHIQGAVHISSNEFLQEFLANINKKQGLVVCCYHGNDSQHAAQYFSNLEFSEVYSLDGGFELWSNHYPELVSVSE